jgi:hypothetical protein
MLNVGLMIIDFSLIGFNSEASLALVSDQVIGLSLKDSFVLVAHTFPVFNEQLFDTRHLVSKCFESNLASIWQVSACVVRARLWSSIVFVWLHLSVNRLSQFFYKQVKHVQGVIVAFNRIIFLNLIVSCIAILKFFLPNLCLCLFHFEQLFVLNS